MTLCADVSDGLSAFEHGDEFELAQYLRGDVDDAEEENPNHQPKSAVNLVVFACTEFFARTVEQHGGDDAGPNGCRQTDVADGGNEAGGEQQAGNQGRQEGEGGGFGAAGHAVVPFEDVGDVVKETERYAEEGGGNRHVGEEGQYFVHAAGLGELGQGFDEDGDLPFGGDDGGELAARQVALDGDLPQDINHQRDQRARPKGFGHFGRIAFKVFEQAGDVAVEAEGSEADGQGGGGVNPVARACGGLGVEEDGQFDIGNQPAGRPDESQHHAADEDGGETVHQAGGCPHAGGENQEEGELSDGQRDVYTERAAQPFGGQVAADEDVGVGK